MDKNLSLGAVHGVKLDDPQCRPCFLGVLNLSLYCLMQGCCAFYNPDMPSNPHPGKHDKQEEQTGSHRAHLHGISQPGISPQTPFLRLLSYQGQAPGPRSFEFELKHNQRAQVVTTMICYEIRLAKRKGKNTGSSSDVKYHQFIDQWKISIATMYEGSASMQLCNQEFTKVYIKEERDFDLNEKTSLKIKEERHFAVKDRNTICVKQEFDVVVKDEYQYFEEVECQDNVRGTCRESDNDDFLCNGKGGSDADPLSTFVCVVCGMPFSTKCDLEIHQQIHVGGKSLSCNVCRASFVEESQFLLHVKGHSADIPLRCAICSKTFPKKCKLLIHMRVHTGDKPYSCTVCNKRFTQKGTLGTHMRLHAGQKPFSCDICNKKFSQKGHQVRHMRVHTDEKPYSCEICSKNFSQKDSLSTHMRVHTGEKPYMCKLCHKDFFWKNGLVRHMRQHTGDSQ
nr:zinc finger protein 235-like [Penaeus vannamei]